MGFVGIALATATKKKKEQLKISKSRSYNCVWCYILTENENACRNRNISTNCFDDGSAVENIMNKINLLLKNLNRFCGSLII